MKTRASSASPAQHRTITQAPEGLAAPPKSGLSAWPWNWGGCHLPATPRCVTVEWDGRHKLNEDLIETGVGEIVSAALA